MKPPREVQSTAVDDFVIRELISLLKGELMETLIKLFWVGGDGPNLEPVIRQYYLYAAFVFLASNLEDDDFP